MAKYSIEGSTLTGIADAIRSKTGSSGIVKVEDMAVLIAAIETGGGSTDAMKSSTGTITIASNVLATSKNIEHGLGVTPKLCGIYLCDSEFSAITATRRIITGAYNNIESGISHTWCVNGNFTIGTDPQSINNQTMYVYNAPTADATSFTASGAATGNQWMYAGTTYRWFAIA